MKSPITLLLAITFSYWASLVSAANVSLPADSIYQLESTFSDQSGQEFQLANRRGKPQLVAMFYTSCKFVCPLIVDSAKGVERALSLDEKDRLSILLVSMDPARDDTAALKFIADKRKLDAAHWTLARTDERGVRKLSALLGVRYRALADGEFNHTSTLFLLDTQGRKIASSSQLGGVPEPAFMAAVRAATQQSD